MYNRTMIILVLMAFIAPAELCSAAIVHGTIYDLSLEKAKDVVVTVNTSTTQRMISKDGTYSFQLPIGNYRIIADHFENNLTRSSAEENISIVGDGDYNLDLFLYPNFQDEEDLGNNTVVDIPKDYVKKNEYYTLIIIMTAIIIAFMVVSVLLYMHTRSKAAEEISKKPQLRPDLGAQDELEHVLDIIKAQGGRTTQKDIRKELPLSEAKVSLIITELESKGYIEKIKKGRGNIIILRNTN
jgi:uncharacterized membrane protein